MEEGGPPWSSKVLKMGSSQKIGKCGGGRLPETGSHVEFTKGEEDSFCGLGQRGVRDRVKKRTIGIF